MNNINVINEIQSKTDIVNIISSYLPLTQKDKDFTKIGGFYGKK
jgi:DNA primase